MSPLKSHLIHLVQCRNWQSKLKMHLLITFKREKIDSENSIKTTTEGCLNDQGVGGL